MGIKRKYLEWERMTDLGAKATGKLPKSKPEAVKAGSKHYYTGVPCKHGHLTVRVVGQGCPRCSQLKFRGEALDSRPPHNVKCFNQQMNLHNRRLGFRSPEGAIIED